MRQLPRLDDSVAGTDLLTEELLLPTLRLLIVTSAAVSVLFYLIVVAVPSMVDVVPSLFVATAAHCLGAALALRLSNWNLRLGLLTWVLAVSLAVILGFHLLRQPQVFFLLAVVPFAAAVVLNWPAGLLGEAGIVILLGWLRWSHGAASLPSEIVLGAVAGGALAGVLGWAATTTSRNVVRWSRDTAERMSCEVRQAREQRVELKEVQEDLLLANRELARLTDRLRVLQREADEARRAKEQFVANVSHELRTPLNMILGFSEMITEAPHVYGNKLPPSLWSDINAIRVNSEHLLKLVNDVLDLSSIEARRVVLVKEKVSIQDIIEAAVVAVRPLFESKGLSLTKEIDPALPPVVCDGTRIRQVILNLLSNAGRYTEQGGVTIRARCEQGSVVVSVSDTGPGINAEEQKKLFEPFGQLSGSLRRVYGGSGLGLCISKQFIEMHQGKIWLESTVGEGTTFFFSLPVETPPLAAPPSHGGYRRWFSPYATYEGRTRRSRAPKPDVSPRFVVLESGQTLQRLLGRYAEGMEIVGVQSIDAALAELERSSTQALIVNAPPIEDTASRERLAKLDCDTPIVTCWVPGEDDVARRLGVVRYLTKPVTRAALMASLGSLGDIELVLLVDDEPDVLQLFARMTLSAGRGYRVLRAQNGQRALELLRERKPDVMVLDLVMPGTDGFQVLQQKSKDPVIRDIPVIIVSSRDPGGESIVSNTITLTYSRGLSISRLLGCIKAISNVLSPLE